MASFKILYRYILISGLFFLTTCSVEKNTGASRLYHGMTARYNIYFNAIESFKAGLVRIEKGHQDDYAIMLNVFESSDPATVSLCTQNMEYAIQKASKLITLKSITAKPEIKKGETDEADREFLERKEYNEWVDDSYLLIGKARFYKHEFPEAASVFTYCISNANDPEIIKEATIWLARVNNETRNYNAALQLINGLDISTGFTNTMKSLYYTTVADLYVKQKNYNEAVDPLKKAIDLVSGKRTRYRLIYLLAQLYQQTGNGELATENYRRVVKMNPPYDVEFNARINIAGTFDINSGNPEELRSDLEKMLRNSKNKDFRDQIYFALGTMSMKEGKEDEAVDYMLKSANSISMNPNQKGRSYLALADHFYGKKDYKKAETYYDSTTFFLDQKHPDYNSIYEKTMNLKALVSQLKIIEREDSLQKVASMPETERNSLIAKIIATAAREQTKSTENDDRYNIGQYYENERRNQGNIEQEGKWYFYNQSALTFGRTEFRRRWGNRRLEDNWRRSNKTRVNIAQVSEDDGTLQQGKDTSAAVTDFTKPGFYLKDLPLTDSAMAISNERISLALLDAGKAYSERIQDTTLAAETLDLLTKRFPGSPLIPEALYMLYNLNREQKSARAETYRNYLIEKYPLSEFARILSDPAYYEKKTADLKINENLYEEAYGKYSIGNYKEAINLSDAAIQKYPRNSLAPKFLLLRAYSVAAISDERKFREELNVVIKTWPGTAESKKASELISYLDEKRPELKVEEDIKIAAELFVADTTTSHVFVVVINNASFNINQATFDVISYNIDNYANKNFKVEGKPVDNKYIMITVSGFPTIKQAMEYYKKFEPKLVIRNSADSNLITFIINEKNLTVLANDKNPERYRLFFLENYLK